MGLGNQALDWLCIMIKENANIKIVRSSIGRLSSISQESGEAILAVLSKYFSDVELVIVNNYIDLELLVLSCPDLVFLGMEYVAANNSTDLFEDKIWVSDYLDLHGVTYTGSGRIAHENGRHKQLAKQLILDAGLKSSAFRVIGKDQWLDVNDLNLVYPLFIKPTNRGGGLGIDSDSVAHNYEQLDTKVRSIISNYQCDVLVEEYLPGREFSVAILKDIVSDEYLAMPIELVAPADINGNRLLGKQVKSSNAEQAFMVIDGTVKSSVCSLALEVFRTLGARDYGRIDIRLDATGAPHFLEANLIPSLISGYGSFPKACVLNTDMEHEAMIVTIARLGLARAPLDSLLDNSETSSTPNFTPIALPI